MRHFLKMIDLLSLAGAGIAVLSLAVLVIVGSLEIVLRNVFGISLQFVIEYNGYLLALTFLGGAGQAMREGGHIRVSMLMQALPRHLARYLDILCTLAGLAIAVCLAVAMSQLAYGSYRYETVSFYASQTPLFYPQAAVAAMLWIFNLSLVARLFRLILGEMPETRTQSMPEAG